MAEDLDLDMKLSGAHAPWQNALAERHGAILEDAYNAIVTSLHIVGKEDVALALCGGDSGKERHPPKEWRHGRDGSVWSKTPLVRGSP